jgi:hypothetical protein
MFRNNKFPNFKMEFAPGKSIAVEWFYGIESCPIVIELSYEEVSVKKFYEEYWPKFKPKIPIQMTLEMRQQMRQNIEQRVKKLLPKKYDKKKLERIFRKVDPDDPKWANIKKEKYWQQSEKNIILKQQIRNANIWLHRPRRNRNRISYQDTYCDTTNVRFYSV